MNYQDSWIKGQVTEKGDRECESRYEIVKAFCSQYRRPFTVLDVGANLCYFGVRLTEDFPECTVAAIEYDSAEGALNILNANESLRVILLAKLIDLDDLRCLAECEHFDLVLGLSVIHRFNGSWAERLQVFRSLGDHLILEIPNEDCTGGNVDPDYELPEDAQVIGHGKSHLIDGGLREIVLFSRPKLTLRKAYLDSDRTDLFMAILSDFSTKRIRFYNKPEAERDWLRGINLQTYLKWGGIWPSKPLQRRMLTDQKEQVLAAGHGDINPWNVILQGDGCRFIDVHGPMEVDYPDPEYFDKLLEALR